VNSGLIIGIAEHFASIHVAMILTNSLRCCQDFGDTFVMLQNSPSLCLYVFAYSASILAYNVRGRAGGGRAEGAVPEGQWARSQRAAGP
jgi:hypothetical protein